MYLSPSFPCLLTDVLRRNWSLQTKVNSRRQDAVLEEFIPVLIRTSLVAFQGLNMNYLVWDLAACRCKCIVNCPFVFSIQFNSLTIQHLIFWLQYHDPLCAKSQCFATRPTKQLSCDTTTMNLFRIIGISSPNTSQATPNTSSRSGTRCLDLHPPGKDEVHKCTPLHHLSLNL